MSQKAAGAQVKADLEVDEAVAIWARIPRRGGPTRLFAPEVLDAKDGVIFNEERAMADPLICAWTRQKQFRPVVNWKFKKRNLIHFQNR